MPKAIPKIDFGSVQKAIQDAFDTYWKIKENKAQRGENEKTRQASLLQTQMGLKGAMDVQRLQGQQGMELQGLRGKQDLDKLREEKKNEELKGAFASNVAKEIKARAKPFIDAFSKAKTYDEYKMLAPGGEGWLGKDKFDLLKAATDSAAARQEITTAIARDTIPDYQADFTRFSIDIQKDLGHLLKDVDWGALSSLYAPKENAGINVNINQAGPMSPLQLGGTSLRELIGLTAGGPAGAAVYSYEAAKMAYDFLKNKYPDIVPTVDVKGGLKDFWKWLTSPMGQKRLEKKQFTESPEGQIGQLGAGLGMYK